MVRLPHFDIFVNINAYIIVNKDSKTNVRANECARKRIQARVESLHHLAFAAIAPGAFATFRDFR